jgi:hypothetical protein
LRTLKIFLKSFITDKLQAVLGGSLQFDEMEAILIFRLWKKIQNGRNHRTDRLEIAIFYNHLAQEVFYLKQL